MIIIPRTKDRVSNIKKKKRKKTPKPRNSLKPRNIDDVLISLDSKYLS